MRKFKLIKEYPGSDAEGTVVVTGSTKDVYKGFRFNYIAKDVENNPEYWEEVKESGYQIISFTASMWGKDTLATLLPNGEYSINSEAKYGWSLKEMLMLGNSVKNGMIQIHSVKRISDGEIFTIGDRAKTITSKGSHTITQFRIRQYCTGRSRTGEWNYDGIDRIWMDWEKDCGGNWLEFTEKVIENDYEILSYVAKDNPKMITLKRRGAHLHEEYWKIHSIKRLSDGEIFTVGDKFKANIGGSIVIRTIESIGVRGNVLTIYQENGWLTNEKEYGGIFSEIQKVEPVYTTEDGKDIFEGDRVIWVKKDSLSHDTFTATAGVKFFSNLNAYFISAVDAQNYINKNTTIFTTQDGVGIKKDEIVYVVDGGLTSIDMISNFVPQDYPTRKAFSTKATAENYIIQNRYALSIKDFWEFDSWGGSDIAKYKRLKRLVKERIGMQ